MTTTPAGAATPLSVLIVDDEIDIRKMIATSLELEGHRVTALSNPADALAEARRRTFHLGFIDLRLGTKSGLDLVPELLRAAPWTKLVVITAYASIETALESIRRGAHDYLTKPCTPAQVREVAARFAELRARELQAEALRTAAADDAPENELSTLSAAMQGVLAVAKRVAAAKAAILIRGESGAGKGVLARAIHRWADDSDRPFAVVSCSALPADTLERELFGHAHGAFAGAVQDSPGRLSACDGGTLFLDEIGDLPAAIQPRLLRFLQDHEYERVGEPIPRRADVRLIAATNADLEKSVKEGGFRGDLFYRLNVIQLTIPPLRERADDIPALARRLLAFFAREHHRPGLAFTDRALQALRAHAWPGNVRELRNVIERAVILAGPGPIDVDAFPALVEAPPAAPGLGDRASLDTIEELHIRRVLGATRSLDEAAAVLGIDSATLWRKRKKFAI